MQDSRPAAVSDKMRLGHTPPAKHALMPRQVRIEYADAIYHLLPALILATFGFYHSIYYVMFFFAEVVAWFTHCYFLLKTTLSGLCCHFYPNIIR